MAITTPLVATRNLAFAPTLEIEYFGAPLPIDGATVSMEVRLYPGAAGDPLVEDADVDIISDELVAPSVLNPDSGLLEPLRRLTIGPRIERADLEALPGLNQPEAGSTQTFYQEIKITYADEEQDTLWIGDFAVEPGVNQA